MERRYEGEGTHYSKIQTYIAASEYFLKQRSFEDCCKYAQKAIEIGPYHSVPSRILAIAKVLMLCSTTNEEPNHYLILNLPLYTQDQQLIKTNFTKVTKLLNPNQNKYPFASEAFRAVLRAWSVLSNPTQKARFDNGLKNKEKGGSFCGAGSQSGNTFWTVCPYCYYVYEFLKDYLDCCLRCQNEKCRRVFHGVPIVGPPPPPEVAEKGEYCCFGFSVLGTEGNSLWSPFVKKNDDDEIIEISDDEVEDGNGRKEESLGVEKGFVKINDVKVTKECTVDMGDNFKKRIKMVANCTKKVLGKADKVNMNFEVEGNDELHLDNVGEKTNENDVEFLLGVDDDIYLDFDMGMELDMDTLRFL